MITLNQLVRGIETYIEEQIIPKLSGPKRYGAMVYAALAGENAARVIPQYLDHPAIKMLGVVDENNMVDLDKVHEAMLRSFHDDRLTIDIPVIGSFTFSKADVDRLCDIIRRTV